MFGEVCDTAVDADPGVRYPPSTRSLRDSDLCASTGHLLLGWVIHCRTPPLAHGLGQEDVVILQGASGFPTFPSFGSRSLAWSPVEQDPQGACGCPGQAASCLLVLFQWRLLCSHGQRPPSAIRMALSGPRSSCSFVAFSVISHIRVESYGS